MNLDKPRRRRFLRAFEWIQKVSEVEFSVVPLEVLFWMAQASAPGRVQDRVEHAAADSAQLDVIADDQIREHLAGLVREHVRLVDRLPPLRLLGVEYHGVEIAGPNDAEALGCLESEPRVRGLGEPHQAVDELVQHARRAVLGETLRQLQPLVKDLELRALLAQLPLQAQQVVDAAALVVARLQKVMEILFKILEKNIFI